jgi:hypothetical protein
MADINSIVSSIKSQGGEARKVFDGSSAKNSMYITKKEDKANTKQAVSGKPNEVAKIDTARLTSGVYAPTKIESSSITPADYYRRGRLKPTERGGSGRQTIGTEFDYMPRFIQDPENEEIASIRLLGKPSDSSRSQPIDLIPPFSKFFLENYQEGHMERSQIVETFGDFYVFFFGERPPVYTFSGTLLNTQDINWKEDFMFYYEKFLRGTKCVEYQAKILLTYGLSQVEGFILNVNMQAAAANDKGVQVSWQVLVTDRKSMRLSLDFGIVEDNGKFNEDRSIIEALRKGISDPNTSDSYTHANKALTGKANAALPTIPKTSDFDKIKKLVPGADIFKSGGKLALA